MNGAVALFAGAERSPAGLGDEELAASAGAAIAERTGRMVPVLYARQVHGRLSYTYGAEGELPAGPVLVGACDALITAEPGVAMLVRTADCLPVALAGGGAAAMVHAGWRGLAADVLGAVVRRLGAEMGVRADRLAAVIGVGVGPCHYPVGPEVLGALAALDCAGAPWRAGESAVDLAAWARGRLLACGLDAAAVETLPGCTACDPALHSHRRDGAAAGRQWSAVMLEEDARR